MTARIRTTKITSNGSSMIIKKFKSSNRRYQRKINKLRPNLLKKKSLIEAKNTKNSLSDNMTMVQQKTTNIKSNSKIKTKTWATSMNKKIIIASHSPKRSSKSWVRANINKSNHTTPLNTINILKITEDLKGLKIMNLILVISVNLQTVRHFILSNNTTSLNNSGTNNLNTKNRMSISKWQQKNTTHLHSNT